VGEGEWADGGREQRRRRQWEKGRGLTAGTSRGGGGGKH
jgi:hypothetical protein